MCDHQKSESKIILDEYIIEAKHLWNTSGLTDIIIESANKVLDEFEEHSLKEINFDECPSFISRKMGLKLVKQTSDMILELYSNMY